ncbi:MAG: PLDc N-terminal domain-containing protein [Puniceicoccales bacterium]
MDIQIAGIGLLMIVIFAINLALFAFWIWMLIDCVTHEPSEGNDKIIWVLIIVLLNFIGALVYFFVRRTARKSGAG